MNATAPGRQGAQYGGLGEQPVITETSPILLGAADTPTVSVGTENTTLFK